MEIPGAAPRGGGGGGWGEGLETEGSPCVVEAVRVGEADVATRRAILGVSRLHPHDGFGDAGLGTSSDGEAAHAAGGPGEGGSVDANVGGLREPTRRREMATGLGSSPGPTSLTSS